RARRRSYSRRPHPRDSARVSCGRDACAGTPRRAGRRLAQRDHHHAARRDRRAHAAGRRRAARARARDGDLGRGSGQTAAQCGLISRSAALGRSNVMRLSLRFIVPLGIALAAIAYAVVPLVDRLTLQWFVRDLEIRSTTIANAVQEPLTALVREPRARQNVLRYFERIIQDERIFAIGFCDPAGNMLYATSTFLDSVRCPQAGEAVSQNRLVQLERGPLHVSVNPISAEGEALGELVIVHDMSFVQRRSEDTKKYIFYLFAAIAAVVALITVVIAEISWRGWVAGIKGLISGEALLGARDESQILWGDRQRTGLNSSHVSSAHAVLCLARK